MKILILGATGMIGRRVVPLLLASGHSVTAAGRSRERLARLAGLGAETATVDLFDRQSVARLVDGNAVVVNLTTHVPGTGVRAFLPGAWREMDRIRREGSAIVADAAIAAGVERVVQESFGLTYPDSGAGWVDERVMPRPAAYNQTALDAEASASRVTEAGGVGVALRFALLYGGAEDGFTRDVLRYAARGWLPLFGRPDGYVSMVTHDDAAGAVVAALSAPPGVYNVVDDEPLSRSALAHTIADTLGVPPPKLPPRWVASMAGSLGETIARSLRLSNRSLRGATGWQPRYPSGREGWRAAAQSIATVEAERHWGTAQ
jgi:nucleoside-diphosphate-sugar epimerase